ncbi:hypothetical protein HOH87_05930 [bacterium]|jgi:hypothetical protein|nr:hypothetical protein [bacterium]
MNSVYMILTNAYNVLTCRTTAQVVVDAHGSEDSDCVHDIFGDNQARERYLQDTNGTNNGVVSSSQSGGDDSLRSFDFGEGGLLWASYDDAISVYSGETVVASKVQEAFAQVAVSATEPAKPKVMPVVQSGLEVVYGDDGRIYIIGDSDEDSDVSSQGSSDSHNIFENEEARIEYMKNTPLTVDGSVSHGDVNDVNDFNEVVDWVIDQFEKNGPLPSFQEAYIRYQNELPLSEGIDQRVVIGLWHGLKPEDQDDCATYIHSLFKIKHEGFAFLVDGLSSKEVKPILMNWLEGVGNADDSLLARMMQRLDPSDASDFLIEHLSVDPNPNIPMIQFVKKQIPDNSNKGLLLAYREGRKRMDINVLKELGMSNSDLRVQAS